MKKTNLKKDHKGSIVLSKFIGSFPIWVHAIIHVTVLILFIILALREKKNKSLKIGYIAGIIITFLSFISIYILKSNFFISPLSEIPVFVILYSYAILTAIIGLNSVEPENKGKAIFLIVLIFTILIFLTFVIFFW